MLSSTCVRGKYRPQVTDCIRRKTCVIQEVWSVSEYILNCDEPTCRQNCKMVGHAEGAQLSDFRVSDDATRYFGKFGLTGRL